MSLPAGALISQPHGIVGDLERFREVPAQESIRGECGHGNTCGHVIAGRYQVGEGVHDAEPQARVAGHRDRGLLPGTLGGQECRDGRPPWVRR